MVPVDLVGWLDGWWLLEVAGVWLHREIDGGRGSIVSWSRYHKRYDSIILSMMDVDD